MKLSFLVTLYNKAAFLPHVLAGLQAQEGDFERQYVFVDDGSTDGTPDLLRQLTQGWQNLVIVTQPNAGPARALNAGLARVDGDWVKPLDGDDLLLPWATRDLLRACAEHGTDYAYAPMDLQARYDSTAPVQFPDHAPAPSRLHADFLMAALRRPNTNPSVLLARTDLLRRLGGSDEGVFIQDYSLELRLAGSGPAARLEGPVMAMPLALDGRLSNNEAQTQHDVNLALVRFLRARRDFSFQTRRFAMNRASGRAWNWSQRERGGISYPRLMWMVLRAKLGVLLPDEPTERLLCRAFRKTHRIRIATL
jgi:glycosyltransferase involved in cell wall biosynthesis